MWLKEKQWTEPDLVNLFKNGYGVPLSQYNVIILFRGANLVDCNKYTRFVLNWMKVCFPDSNKSPKILLGTFVGLIE